MALTLEIEAFIIGRVASGRFRNASEAVRAALRLSEDEQRRKVLERPDQAGERWVGR